MKDEPAILRNIADPKPQNPKTPKPQNPKLTEINAIMI